MKHSSFFLLVLMCLSCSLAESDKNLEQQEGWSACGLEPNVSEINEWGTGLLSVTHVGNRLFVMDGKAASKTETYRKDFRIFTAIQGVMTWDTLKVPGGVSPYCMFADSQYLYVGTDRTSQILRYDPTKKTWTDLKAFQDSTYRVYCISKYKGKLVASLKSGYRKGTPPILMQQENGTWINIADSSADTLIFHHAAEYEGDLIVTSYQTGIWRWNSKNAVWTRMPDPKHPTVSGVNQFPRSIAIHKGNLYVGFWAGGGIHQWSSSQNKWIHVDSIRVDSLGQSQQTTPLDVYSLLSDQKNLIAAGYSTANPSVYMGETEAKGWRRISRETFCGGKYNTCFASIVLDMTIVGDTLYAAGWEGLIKYPLKKIADGIKDAPSYP